MMTTQTPPIPKQPTDDPHDVFELLCSIATIALNWSWEGTVGMEEQVEVVGAAYGYDNVTSIFSAQSAQLKMGDQQTIIKGGIPGIPPLFALAKAKKIMNEIITHKLSAREATRQVNQLSNAPSLYKRAFVILGVVLLSAMFSIDVVGNWEGVVVAAITGIVAGAVFVSGTHTINFDKIAPLLATFLVSVCVMAAWRLGWVAGSPGLLLIPATFIFIPGDSISTQSYELADGRWSPAVDRLAYSVMVLILQAAGVALAAVLLNVLYADLLSNQPANIFPWWAVYISHTIFAVGVMLAFQMQRSDLPLVIFIVLIVTAVSQLGTILYSGLMGTFAGAVVMTLIAAWLGRSAHRPPAYVYIIAPLFLLTPGSHGLKALESLISGQTVAGITGIQSLLANLTAIGIGIFIGRFILFQATLYLYGDIIRRHAPHIHIPRYHYKSRIRMEED